MSLLATAADYVPANAVQGGTALYYQPHDGSGYHPENDTNIPARVAWIESLIPTTAGKVAVWGCSWGYMVQLLVNAGYDAYGFDGSSWAITTGQSRYSAISSRLFVEDATITANINTSKAQVGLGPIAKFALLITDDMLTCCSDAEISTMLPLLRNVATRMAHVVTPLDPTTTQDARLNWKTTANWKTVVSPDTLLDVWGNVI
jgi:hypothetical protein